MRMPESALPSHAVLVLAAGQSRRLGTPKQLLEVDGEPLLRRAVRIALQTNPHEVIVVFGAAHEPMRDALHGLECRSIVCADAAIGMSATLRDGLAAVDARCAGALVLLTDQPALNAEHLQALVSRWQRDTERAAASGYAGTIGVPALLPRAWFGAASEANTDRGARDLLRARSTEVDVIDAPALAFDLDSKADLARWGDRALQKLDQPRCFPADGGKMP